MALPAALHVLSEHVQECESVLLFIERARAVKPDFNVTDQTAGVVAEICRRLDGLPLAIELAAARVRLLTIEDLLKRLDRRLPLLSTRALGVPSRQQTLRSTIGWSYDLLEEAERVIFRRMGVFVAGATLEAADAVASGAECLQSEVLERLESLVAKSLVQQSQVAGETRLGMLETIREFALDELARSGEDTSVRRSHAAFFADLAEQAETGLADGQQVVWLERLDAEQGNISLAIRWYLDHEPDAGLRLAGSMSYYWQIRGRYVEWHRSLDDLLARAPAHTRARAKALAMAARGASWRSELELAERLGQEALELARELGEERLVALSSSELGFPVLLRGNVQQAQVLVDQGLELSRHIGEPFDLQNALFLRALVGLKQGDYATTQEALEEGLQIAKGLGNPHATGFLLFELGRLVALLRNDARAVDLLEEALRCGRAVRDSTLVVYALSLLAAAVARQRDVNRAVALLREALEQSRELGNGRASIRVPLLTAAWFAMFAGDESRALRLLGAAHGTDNAMADFAPTEVAAFQTLIAGARAALGEDQYNAQWSRGVAMTNTTAIAYALEGLEANT